MHDLIAVLEATRVMLALPGNDFCWSSWEGQEQSLREIDSLIAELKAGRIPDRLTMQALYAPTGPIQEVSVSSGWGYKFLELAKRFDAAEKQLSS